MKIITKRDLIRALPERFRKQYPSSRHEIAEQLDALDLETVEEDVIGAILKNWSWTRMECDSCGYSVDTVYTFNLQHNRGPVGLCVMCVHKLRDLRHENND